MFRCAKGFLKLPVPYKDNAAAKKLLITGLKIAPNNSFGHHLMANYYERVEKVRFKICLFNFLIF